MTITAFKYVWDPKEPTAQPGIAISNRGGRYPRVFIRTKEEALAIATAIVDLALNEKTWNQPKETNCPTPSNKHYATPSTALNDPH